MDIKGKNILLTGGSLGIGKETAKALVEMGANVLITGRSEDRLKKAAEHSGAKYIVFDISDLDNISSKANECLQILENRVDVLINNAGIGFRRNIEDLNADDFMTIYKTNVFGLSLLTKEITTCMKDNKSGTIINIGSTASLKGYKGGSIYSSSKFAVRSLTQCWQAELRPYNIRVCQLNPSEVTTAFANKDRIERDEIPNKLTTKEIAHSIVSVIEMDDRGFINELNVWATNPF